MIILCLRTDSPITQILLYRDNIKVAEKTVETGRSLGADILTLLEEFLGGQGFAVDQIEGLVCFEGPGSFTGLRIGHTVMNALAYSLNVPIIQMGSETWAENGVALILSGVNHKLVIPRYGSEAHITLPKK